MRRKNELAFVTGIHSTSKCPNEKMKPFSKVRILAFSPFFSFLLVSFPSLSLSRIFSGLVADGIGETFLAVFAVSLLPYGILPVKTASNATNHSQMLPSTYEDIVCFRHMLVPPIRRHSSATTNGKCVTNGQITNIARLRCDSRACVNQFWQKQRHNSNQSGVLFSFYVRNSPPVTR